MNVLIKFSGEFFSAKDELTKEGLFFLNHIKNLELKSGYIVVGGGNRVRGRDSKLSRNTSDKLGVLSTLMNGYLLQEYLAMIQMPSSIFSHFHEFANYYSPSDAMKAYLEEKWVILTTGLGNVGYVSTDLSSVIKGLELNVDAVIKITAVGGVYDKEPNSNNASLLKKVSYSQVINNNLSVMDLSAIAIAAENELPIGICSLQTFPQFMKGEDVGSIIGYDWRK